MYNEASKQYDRPLKPVTLCVHVYILPTKFLFGGNVSDRYNTDNNELLISCMTLLLTRLD